MAEKTKVEELKEQLFIKRENGRIKADDSVLQKADEYCEGYKTFLDNAKTEREAVKNAVEMAKKAGFSEFVIGKEYNAGDRVFINNRGKTVLPFVTSSESQNIFPFKKPAIYGRLF